MKVTQRSDKIEGQCADVTVTWSVHGERGEGGPGAGVGIEVTDRIVPKSGLSFKMYAHRSCHPDTYIDEWRAGSLVFLSTIADVLRDAEAAVRVAHDRIKEEDK